MIPIQNLSKSGFWLGIALPSLALIAVIWVAHLTNGQFNAAFASVTHTYKVLNMLETVQARVADAETGQRGYLLTGNEDYFTLRGSAMGAINNDIQQLKTLVQGNEMQEADLAHVESLIANRFGTNSMTALGNLPADKMAITLTDEGRDIIKEVRGQMFHIREQENFLLVQRQQEAEAQFLLNQTVSVVLVGVTAIALVMIIGTMLRMEHLRQIVTVCAWTGQVKDGAEWVRLEDYLKKRFGVAVSHGLSKEAAEKMVQEMQRSKGGSPSLS